MLAIGAGLYTVRRSQPPSSATSIKAVAPDFTLPQLDGQPLQLSSYRGKIILLDFWATWCDPCREETPHLVELQQKYADRGLQIIGVSMDDSPDPVRSFYQQFHMNYPVVMGNAKVGELYGGVLGLPIAFVLDREGRIVTKHIGATDVGVLEQDVLKFLAPSSTSIPYHEELGGWQIPGRPKVPPGVARTGKRRLRPRIRPLETSS